MTDEPVLRATNLVKNFPIRGGVLGRAVVRSRPSTA